MNRRNVFVACAASLLGMFGIARGGYKKATISNIPLEIPGFDKQMREAKLARLKKMYGGDWDFTPRNCLYPNDETFTGKITVEDYKHHEEMILTYKFEDGVLESVHLNSKKIK